MKELFLRALFTGKKLNIVNQKRINAAVETLKVVNRIKLQRFYHVGHKAFGMQVDHAGIFTSARQRITHCMH